MKSLSMLKTGVDSFDTQWLRPQMGNIRLGRARVFPAGKQMNVGIHTQNAHKETERICLMQRRDQVN